MRDHSGRGRMYGSPGGLIGQLNRACVSDADQYGNTLIVDKNNNRLQVMTEQGQFNVVTFDSSIAEPHWAVYFNGHLYVVSDNPCSVQKYSSSARK